VVVVNFWHLVNTYESGRLPRLCFKSKDGLVCGRFLVLVGGLFGGWTTWVVLVASIMMFV